MALSSMYTTEPIFLLIGRHSTVFMK